MSRLTEAKAQGERERKLAQADYDAQQEHFRACVSRIQELEAGDTHRRARANSQSFPQHMPSLTTHTHTQTHIPTHVQTRTVLNGAGVHIPLQQNERGRRDGVETDSKLDSHPFAHGVESTNGGVLANYVREGRGGGEGGGGRHSLDIYGDRMSGYMGVQGGIGGARQWRSSPDRNSSDDSVTSVSHDQESQSFAVLPLADTAYAAQEENFRYVCCVSVRVFVYKNK